MEHPSTSHAMYRQSYPDEPDWHVDEETLYIATRTTLRRFRQEQGSTIISMLCFDTEPHAGYVLIDLETSAHALAQNRKRAVLRQEQRLALLSKVDAWKLAEYEIEHEQPTDYGPSGPYAFEEYGHAEFPSWEDFSYRENYPDHDPVHRTDFLEGHVRLILWRVIDRLVAEDAFDGMPLNAPFRLCYQFHDKPAVTVRIINWPSLP